MRIKFVFNCFNCKNRRSGEQNRVMISVAEAEQIVFQSLTPLESEWVAVNDGLHRVLVEPVLAQRDYPPFDRVMMDGIAVTESAWNRGIRLFESGPVARAGVPQVAISAETACCPIMTGAPLPIGAGVVIPIENTKETAAGTQVMTDDGIVPGKFIHSRGSDYRRNQEMLSIGQRMSPLDLAVAISCGANRVAVSRQPRLGLISTGDELIAAGSPIQDHQIYSSNVPALVADCMRRGWPRPRVDHLPDDRDLMAERTEVLLQDCDVIVLTGGVSRGKFDYVPEVLEKLGVEKRFHRVAQRPGKPLWFGMGPSGQLVFGLPGNPVSCLVCWFRYVCPALERMERQTAKPSSFKPLGGEFDFDPPLTFFLPVRLLDDGLAQPSPVKNSGDFASLQGSQGWLELPAEQSHYPAGWKGRFWSF